MRESSIVEWADCTEFRQTLLARPPRIVHGTAMLLVGVVGAAVLWAALAQADLVVRARGRVRPVTSPRKVFNASAGIVLNAGSSGRVAAVFFREGDEVRKGDVLLRLDTEQLDNEIARRRRTIEAGQDELTRLARLNKLLDRQTEEALSKADAELAQAETEVKQARARQTADIALVQVELEQAEDECYRTTRLAATSAATVEELTRVRSRVRELREKLKKARLPVDDSKVQVMRRGRELAERDAAVKKEELELKRVSKQGEVDAARLELANLELERKQAELRTPMDGVVTSGDIKVGDVLAAGKAVFEIAEEKGFLFEAEVPSTEVGHLRAGMIARIKLDAYDYQQYGTLAGRVSYVSPDSSVHSEQGAVVYLVRIEVEGDEVRRGDYHGKVKLGMAGQVEIVTEQKSILSLLIQRIRQSISLG
jgi:multidrug resistance efflux pump